MKDELAINVVRTTGADNVAQGTNIANAAAHIVSGRTRFLHSLSDVNNIPSDSNDSAYGLNNTMDVPDGGTSKWKSSRDLTDYDKSKLKKEKKRKKKRKLMISQGLLDLITIGGDKHSDHATSDGVDNTSRTQSISEKNKKQVEKSAMSPALTETVVPNLPTNGRKMIDTLIDIDVDSAYKSAFENDTFFEIITAKTYGEIHNYSVSSWTPTQTSDGSEDQIARTMHYEFPKTIAFSRHTIVVDQVQTKCAWSTPGLAYGVDSVNRTSGAMYTEYFYLETETMSGTKKYYEVFEKELLTEKALTEKVSLQAGRHEERRSNSESYSQNNSINEVNTAQNFVQSQEHVPRTVNRVPVKSSSSTSSKRTKNSQKQPNVTKSNIRHQQKGQPRRILIFNETSVLMAFILVILTLSIITFAMFKLAESIAALSERLYNLEDLLSQYSKECKLVTSNVQ